MHESSPAAEIARSPAAWERLAKDWLVEVIERSPLAEVEGLPLGWIANEAPPLIAEILGQLSDPVSARELELSPAARERAAALAELRLSGDAAGRLPRELAALQSVLIDALGRQSGRTGGDEFARAVGRLAEVFGAMQSAVLDSLVADRSAGAQVDAESGLPGSAELHEWLHLLVSRHRASGAPLSLAHVEVDGVDRIAEGYGQHAAEGMVAALAAVLQNHLPDPGRTFRIGPEQFVLLAPGRDAGEMSSLAARLAGVIERSQDSRGPRLEIAAGIASFPGQGASPSALRDAAEEAAWAARAAGRSWELAQGAPVQDP